MRSVIRQSVVLPARAERLFAMYVDPTAHAAFTGMPVTIGPQEGAEFSAFGGQLSGRILSTLPPRLIVQAWRSTKFYPDDPDSTLILLFTPDEQNSEQGRIELVHLDVPEQDYAGVSEGWQKYYWGPWQDYWIAH
jgi:uncharacterized protein YndB with AHSA1/START domain